MTTDARLEALTAGPTRRLTLLAALVAAEITRTDDPEQRELLRERFDARLEADIRGVDLSVRLFADAAETARMEWGDGLLASVTGLVTAEGHLSGTTGDGPRRLPVQVSPVQVSRRGDAQRAIDTRNASIDAQRLK